MKTLAEVNWVKVGGLVFLMGVASLGLFYSFALLRNEVFNEIGTETPYGFKPMGKKAKK